MNRDRIVGYEAAEGKSLTDIEEVLEAHPNQPFNGWQLGHLACYIDRVKKLREDVA